MASLWRYKSPMKRPLFMRGTSISCCVLVFLAGLLVCSTAFVQPFVHSAAAKVGPATPFQRTLHSKLASTNDVSPEIIPNNTTLKIVHDFCLHVKQSIDDETFCSLTFKGPTVPKKKRQHVATKERLRGCIRQIQARLITLPKRKSNTLCLQVTIKYFGATDVAKNYNLDQIVDGLSSLLLATGDTVASEWGENPIHPCGTELGIQHSLLETTLGSWLLTASPAKPIKLNFQENNTRDKQTTTTAAAPSPMSHDRTKDVPLSTQSTFLQALGLTKPNGKPRPTMSSKLKQCQKFVEICSNLIASVHDSSDTQPIHIVDMGCGRAYLTFSLHSYLFETYGDIVHSCGIDMRPKLVKEITSIARSLGKDFDGLVFQEGTIDSILESTFSVHGETDVASSSSLNVLIALHACDTATDDALWSGIQRDADVIVVAPCCHKQVRRQLDRHFAAHKSDHPLADVLRHGIYRERMAETVTDSLRAILLELANYTVQVFEFIGGEHTGKNVMITAVKRKRTRSKRELEDLRERFRALAALHGVHDQRLAKKMDSRLLFDDESEVDGVATTKPKRIPLSAREMPPIP